LGPHEDFTGMLADFVKGDIIKSSKETRKSYMGQLVIDMSKIRMDFARNEVNAGTLRILDHAFLNDGNTKTTNDEELKDEQPNFGEISSKLKNGISAMLNKKPIVTAQQLGFGFASSDDDNENISEDDNEVPTPATNPKSLIETN